MQSIFLDFRLNMNSWINVYVWVTKYDEPTRNLLLHIRERFFIHLLRIIVFTARPQDMKSVNLQFNTLGRLDDGTNESSTKRLMFQILLFFMISCKILCKNPFNLFSYLLIKLQK